jgi:predicted ATPase/DNA-binding XRE family transcriptional regulator/Tfp pilus assembly protein PilF
MTTEPQPDPTFRDLLRQHRQSAGLTQEELAERAGLSARGISDLERGVRGYPHPDTVRRLAAALSLDDGAREVFLRAAPRLASRSTENPDAAWHAFPAPLTSLVGREEETATIHRWFLEEGHRLVTLQGPGGMGKTRLALAAAERMAGSFREGQVFVDLAPLRDPAFLVAQIASSLGLQEHPGQSLQAILTAYLHPRQLLLVLDNFEHLLPAAPLVSDLLRAAPDLRLLVTSRSPLRVQGERLFQVPPLGHLDAAANDLDAAHANDAVTLFVARAQAVQADFALTAENAATVLAICRRLEGLPLALELAAARISILPLGALLNRLSTSLPLLSSGPRDAPLRHRTLRDAIAWSDDLLEPPVRTFFHCLGIFVGGWTLEAAETVVARDGALDVVEGLAALRDLNLIRVVAGEDEPRYLMLETIREFARERLAASSGVEPVAHVHAAYFSNFALRGAQHLTGSSQGAWLRRLDVETPNLRAALQTLAANEDGDAYLRCAANLGDYWFRRSRFAEGYGHLEAAVTRAPMPSLPRAAALLWLGALAFGQADFDTAYTWLEQCEMLARSLDASSLIYDALFWRGVIAEQMGDTLRARCSIESALAVARNLGDAKGMGSALNSLCLFDLHRGAPELAEQWINEAIPQLLSAGDAFELSVGFANLGEVALARGDVARAKRAFEDALTQAKSSDVTWLFANALVGFAALAAARRDFDIAALLLGATDAVRSESLHPKVPSYVLHTETTRQVRATMSESEFLQAWEAGQALTRDEVLERIQNAGS